MCTGETDPSKEREREDLVHERRNSVRSGFEAITTTPYSTGAEGRGCRDIGGC